jgi:hypothetical protein
MIGPLKCASFSRSSNRPRSSAPWPSG